MEKRLMERAYTAHVSSYNSYIFWIPFSFFLHLVPDISVLIISFCLRYMHANSMCLHAQKSTNDAMLELLWSVDD